MHDRRSPRTLLVGAALGLAVGALAQQPVGTDEQQIQLGRPAGEKNRFAPASTDVVWVPPGVFSMGCVSADNECFDDEKPRHQVALTRGVWMDATPVTVAAYRRYSRETGATMPPSPAFQQSDAQPVVNVSWGEAAAYCTWAGGRLPTEAEWEYAARGGMDGQKYASGATIGHDQANYQGVEGRDRWAKASPVGSFEANPFGLIDMTGNVWQWCSDWYGPRTYTVGAATDPTGPRDGTLRALRGGSWNHTTRSLRLSNRGKFAPAGRTEFFGFRCVRPDSGTPAVAAPGAGVPSTPAAQQATGAPPAHAIAPAPSTPAATTAQTRRFPPAELEMALVPAGAFEMGCVKGDGTAFADEQPRHAVTIPRPFWVGVSEVTFAQYRAFSQATGHAMSPIPNWADDTHPVVGVNWDDAVAFCSWAGGRLPTEAEWEYAARGGRSGLRYPWGNDITHDDANFDGVGARDQWAKSSPVGSFPPNGFGLVDVAGNVWEWCADWYEERFYGAATAVDPKGPDRGRSRVVRGGCWTSDPGRVRTSYRFSLDPSDTQVSLGFRCVRDVTP